MKNGQTGLVLIELLIIVWILVFAIVGVGFIGGVVRGNYWVGEASALKAVQGVDSAMLEVVTLERHIWGYSKVTVRDKDGTEFEFAIDADVLQNRRAFPQD